jgi:hypothetical protein
MILLPPANLNIEKDPELRFSSGGEPRASTNLLRDVGYVEKTRCHCLFVSDTYRGIKNPVQFTSTTYSSAYMIVQDQ